MDIRPFELPQDIDLMISLMSEGFQYPDNPEWNVQEDEKQGMIDQINGAKRMWPIMRLLRIFSPVMRDILCGFIADEAGSAVGLINYMRQRNIPEWHIANVTVLPAHRRRGIARKLVERTLEELRNRNTRTAFLEVVIGNDPALKLYEDVGFEVFTQALQYHYQSDVVIMQPVIPQGYTLKPLGIFDWQTRYELEKRVTPEHITRYEPVTEDHFRAPFVFPLFGQLFERAGGNHTERFAIFSPTGEVVGVGRFNYRTKPGGMNSAQVNIDPTHTELAEFILRHVVSSIQKASPGRRIEISLDDWQSALIESAERLGFEKRFGYHRMGYRFQNYTAEK